jgi:hypothetical protein
VGRVPNTQAVFVSLSFVSLHIWFISLWWPFCYDFSDMMVWMSLFSLQLWASGGLGLGFVHFGIFIDLQCPAQRGCKVTFAD